MDVLDLIRMLHRQLVLTLALAIVLVLTLFAIVFLVAPEYRASGTGLLIRTGPQVGINPYAVVDPAQPQAATMLTTRLTAPQSISELRAAGADGEIAVTNESGPVQDRTPFLKVTVSSDSPAAASRSVTLVMNKGRAELRTIQAKAGVPPEHQLQMVDVVTPEVAVLSRGAQLRALALTTTAGLTLIVMVVAVTDRVRSRGDATKHGPASTAFAPDTGTRASTNTHPVNSQDGTRK